MISLTLMVIVSAISMVAWDHTVLGGTGSMFFISWITSIFGYLGIGIFTIIFFFDKIEEAFGHVEGLALGAAAVDIPRAFMLITAFHILAGYFFI